MLPNDYSTVSSLSGLKAQSDEERVILNKSPAANPIYLEAPNQAISLFYQEHGLQIMPRNQWETNNVISKLNGALGMLGQVPSALEGVTSLVRMIQVVDSGDPEIDVSYSHPQLPFTIFVSVCEDNSEISQLRVAESILHEAMHLKLSLIERVVPLIKPDANGLYFSPWRDEKRPAQGVLHGMFVFRTILDFSQMLSQTTFANNPLNERVIEINEQLEALQQFTQAKALTEYGANLSKSLLP